MTHAEYEELLNPTLPAPWRSGESDGLIVDANGRPIAIISSRFAGCDRHLAEVRGVIVAAPEMLSALELFVKKYNACGPNSDFCRYFKNVRDAAVSALAKATGA